MARAPSLGEVRVLKATRLAEEPEFTVIKCLTPMKAANFFSNSVLKRPVVSQPSIEASTMSLSSCAPMTLPDGGTAEAPGRKGWGARAMAAYSSTSWAICARRARVFVFSIDGFNFESIVGSGVSGPRCVRACRRLRGAVLTSRRSASGPRANAARGASSGGCALWKYRV